MGQQLRSKSLLAVFRLGQVLEISGMVKLGFVSAFNPFDRNEFSGTLYYMREALNRLPNTQVEVLGKKFFESRGIASALYKICTHRKVASIPLFRKLSVTVLTRFVEADLARLAGELDAIIAPVASKAIAGLQSIEHCPPIIFITDATPLYINENYFETLGPEVCEREDITIRRAAKVVYSSSYMAERARQEFECLREAPGKLEVVPFGLNMDVLPPPEKPKVLQDTLSFLFVGKWWDRKGGGIAVQMIEALRDKGVSARLTVVGCRPEGVACEYIEVIPYLNKNIPAEQEKYISLLKQSHFLVLPTRADCTPMVIAEANAFGMPVLVTDVGGIPSLVESGVNGYLFSLQDKGEQYAERVLSLLDFPESYERLSESSRKRYENHLNWDAWAARIVEMATQSDTGEATKKVVNF